MKYLVVCVTFMIYIKNSKPSSFCYWNSGCPYKYLSSKTPYNFVRGDIRDSVIHLKGCEPVSIWGLYRHGKRQPAKEFADKMKSALIIQKYVEASYAAGKSSLCSQDVENLIQWKAEAKLFEGKCYISEDGLQEMEELGKRLKQAFPELLGNLEDESYIFQSVFGHRMKKSIEAFIKGFNDSNLTIHKSTNDFDEESPYSSCKSYQKDISNETILYSEAIKYQNNPEYLAMKDRIQRRSGINYTLNVDNITAIYDLCRYDTSGFNDRLSPWCALFTTDDLIVLEYEGDLRHYYRNGYGQPRAEMFGRIPLNDLLKSFKLAKEGKGKKIVAYSSHSTILDMMFTALGLFKDEEILTGAQRNQSRKWRSTTSTFSSNLVAVLNRCPKNVASEFNVVFYLNEEPLLSICEQGVCTWQEFEQKLTFHNTSLAFCDG